ncbi:zinc metalloendopeptidase M23 domain protein [Geotalea daltonii FRC-32]|uniref:Zinc metalloendopeptidase M23 domain protein n=1 Tax=Geotalea daltonii (strain DSM 22248 / JCM 15807 / FRC-32) TaxID=316067 RepID=B9M460_GEODF|nr:M23 family metallopeptidase [Geotalea daltonii]ACM21515.1 zinc metalloendopeptidase M23 domain protein [Geotalea daltonii FRC-32]
MKIYKLVQIIKKIHVPLTIMVVPHSRGCSRSIRIPFIVAVLCCCMSVVGGVYTVSLTIEAFNYQQLKKRYAGISSEVSEMRSTMISLKESEAQLKQLVSLGSRSKILKNLDTSESGSIDIEELKSQVAKSMDTVKEIKSYLRKERVTDLATPQGWPASGRVSSLFGNREHPLYGIRKFHSGVDISLPTGTPLHATADGVVSFSGRAANNGNITVVEHGLGYSTIYAHNSRNLARAGQTVKRGEVIAYAGSTGASTGPHVHYEIWKNGQSIDPMPFLKRN